MVKIKCSITEKQLRKGTNKSAKKRIGGRQELEFYDPKKCNKQYELKEKFGLSDILTGIAYLWGDPECYLIDNIMHEALLGRSILKSRKKYLFPFHASVSLKTIKLAFRIAYQAHFTIEESLKRTSKMTCPTQKSLKRWFEWLELMKEVIHIMNEKKIKRINVGYV